MMTSSSSVDHERLDEAGEGDATGRRWAGVSAEDRRAERRELLLGAGFELLGGEGTTATVRGICGHARLNPRYFYESFTDLDELVVAVYDRVVSELSEAVFRAAESAPADRVDQIRAGFGAMVDFVATDRRRGRVLFSAALDNAAGRRHGLPAEGDPIGRVGAAILVGGFSELLVAWLDGRIEVTRDQLVDDAAALVSALGDAAGAIARTRRSAG